MADALNVSADHLLGRDPEPKVVGHVAAKVLDSLSRMSARDQDLLVEFAKTLAKR